MITSAIFVGLGLLVAAILLIRRPVFALASLIPFLFAGYYAYAAEMANQLGYSAQVDVVKQTDAQFIHGVQIEDKIYMTVLEDNHKSPRLVEFKASEENKKALEELSKEDSIVSKKITIGKGIKTMLKSLTASDKDGGGGDNPMGLGGQTTVDAAEGLQLHMDENWLPPKDR